MKERPILFSGPMVRAILNGVKSQTRRAVKLNAAGRVEFIGRNWHCDDPDARLACPYGQPGDRLWVRETFQPLFADGVENHSETDWKTGKGYAISYPATDGIQEFLDPDDNISSACKPSIHMPRWGSRILLEITGVRVERLQGISEADARAEGVTCENVIVSTYYANGHHEVREDRYFFGGCQDEGFDSAVDAYAALWESINGAGSWEANPWLWCISFRRINA